MINDYDHFDDDDDNRLGQKAHNLFCSRPVTITTVIKITIIIIAVNKIIATVITIMMMILIVMMTSSNLLDTRCSFSQSSAKAWSLCAPSVGQCTRSPGIVMIMIFMMMMMTMIMVY